ncbi:hypothetical protein [Actinomycetospora sp.]|uniref:hypothetical protein n=1 Tax=Actinomycetospora sp. TaxID=1872135 RepID=UPI002F41F42C
MTTPTTIAEAPLERECLCVAARSVINEIPELMADGLAGAPLHALATHAESLSDLDQLRALAPDEARLHGTGLYDVLDTLGSDRSLTLAVWVGEALGPR